MSNLLEKASILLTPTAYDDGKILSVKPAPSLGSELVTNGDFATDSNWNQVGSNGWSIDTGTSTLNFTNASSYVFQGISTVSGKSYKVTLDIELDSGTIVAKSFSAQNIITVTSTGRQTVTEYFKEADGNANFGFVASDSASGKIHNVSVKELIDGDFDFTRNSSATRVNSQGLIEDVQILSSNLVSNGDFSQEGSELITNGDFSNGSTDWELNPSSGTAIVSNGKLNFTNSTSGGTQVSQRDRSYVVGKTYKITYTVTDYVQGNVRLSLGNNLTTSVSANGTFTQYITYTSGLNRTYIYTVNSTLSIDNVSVKEVGQDWTLGASWSIGNNKATRLTSVDWGLDQTISSAVNGRTYRVTTEITNYTSGELRLALGSGGTVNVIGNALGVYVNEFTWTGSSGSIIRFQGSFVGSISNISILEITEDTNLPRIDYTGGVGHWLFEPQSTNKLTHSQDFNSSAWLLADLTATANQINSPDGTLNASKLEMTGNGSLRNQSQATFSNAYSYSIFVKKGNSRYITLRSAFFTQSIIVGFDLDSETAQTDGKIENYGNDWYRLSISKDISSDADKSGFFYMYLPNSLGGQTSESGNFAYYYGAQIEDSTFATSYIPTSGSTVTRLQDAAFGAGSSDLINSTEGVLYAEIAKFQDINDNYRLISISNNASNSNNNTITIGFSNSNKFYFRIAVNGVSILLNTTTFNATKNQYYKVAIKFNALGDNAAWIDGVEVISNTTSFTYPIIMDNLSFNYNGNGGLPFYGKTKCVAVFKEALTDAELTCLTTI